MNEEGRVKKSAKNMASGMLFRVISMLTAFIVRTVFIKCLSNDYLSVNGLYSSILNMLSLAELGFSTAMVYSMYKPLAEKDYIKLSQIMRLYKRVYQIVGSVVLILGLLIVPFLDVIIKNKPDINGLTFYYLLFLFNSVISYWFFAYRSSVLQADQRAFVTSNYSTIFNIIKTILQIVLLLIFKNFTIYLMTQIMCTIAQNILIAIRVKKDYPIFKNSRDELSKSEKSKIYNDVKALMIQKVSFKILNGSDSIIISAFVGVNWVGLLSNYIMIEQMIVAVLSEITSSISASLGNLFVKTDKNNGYIVFKRIDFMNYWLYGFSVIALITLSNPFVELWLGKSYLLNNTVIIALFFRFFIEGYINTMSTFRSTLGLFNQGKYLPLIVAGLNIVLSIGLSYPLGVAGVLFATPISRLCINGWYMPFVIHRDGFNKPVKPYYFKLLFRFSLLACVVVVMQLISSAVFVGGVTIIKFIIMVIITAILPNVIFALVFNKIEEFKYFKTLFFKNILKKVILAIKSCKIKN